MAVRIGDILFSAITALPLTLWLLGIIALGTFKILLGFLFFLFVILPVIFRCIYPLQRSVIFLNFINHPLKADFNAPEKFGLQGTKNFYVTTSEGITLGVWHILPASLRNSSRIYHDDFFEESLSHGEPVFIYMHGNSGSRASAHRVELYKILSDVGCHVIAFDYRSYGDSSDVAPSEPGIVADALFMFKWADARAKNAQLFIWGHSLGTGVAAHVTAALASEGPVQPGGLILESPFNNLRDELKEHPLGNIFRPLPWFEYCFVDSVIENGIKFETDKHLLKARCPIVIFHAEDDAIIPFTLGERLYKTVLERRDRIFGPMQFVKFEGKHGYGHKWICRAPDLPDFMKKFLSDKMR